MVTGEIERSRTPDDDVIWEGLVDGSDNLWAEKKKEEEEEEEEEEEKRFNETVPTIKKRKVSVGEDEERGVRPSRAIKRIGPFIDESDSEGDGPEEFNDELIMAGEENQRVQPSEQLGNGRSSPPWLMGGTTTMRNEPQDVDYVYFDESQRKEEQEEDRLARMLEQDENDEDESAVQLEEEDGLFCTEESVCPICQISLGGLAEMVSSIMDPTVGSHLSCANCLFRMHWHMSMLVWMGRLDHYRFH